VKKGDLLEVGRSGGEESGKRGEEGEGKGKICSSVNFSKP